MQRCQKETTSTEFVAWQQYLEWEMNTHEKMDYYFAQLTAEIRKLFRKNPGNVRVEHCLLRFNANKANKAPTTEELKKRTAFSKARWFAIANPKAKRTLPSKEH